MLPSRKDCLGIRLEDPVEDRVSWLRSIKKGKTDFSLSLVVQNQFYSMGL